MPELSIDTLQQAGQFIDELERISSIARYRMTGSYDEAPWGRPNYSTSPQPTLPKSVNGQPAGIIVHYTASPSMESAVRWFCDAKLDSQRAAHLVIAQDSGKLFSQQELEVFPMMKALSALPVLCRGIRKAAVHASWCNGWTVGIELVNLGCDTAGRVAQTRTLAPACGRTWERYPVAQVETAALVVRALRLVFPAISLDAVLGHEHVQGAQTPNVLEDKRDPGPLFPWREFRDRVRLPRDMPPATTLPSYANDMEKLGYYMRGLTQQNVKVFQYMAGLVADGVVGPRTQSAISQRLLDRGLRGLV